MNKALLELPRSHRDSVMSCTRLKWKTNAELGLSALTTNAKVCTLVPTRLTCPFTNIFLNCNGWNHLASKKIIELIKTQKAGLAVITGTCIHHHLYVQVSQELGKDIQKATGMQWSVHFSSNSHHPKGGWLFKPLFFHNPPKIIPTPTISSTS